MGKSDVKLQRFLSLPSNLGHCKSNEFYTTMTIDKDKIDTDKILVRQISVKLQVKPNLSSGTSTEKLPEGLFRSLCTSDTHKRYKKEIKTLNRNIADSEMVRNMPMIRDDKNRRTALGYIFQDTNPADLNNLLSVFDNRTNSENIENMPESEVNHHRRAALGDIFQDLDEEDLEHLVSMCEDTGPEFDLDFELNNETCFRRRLGLPDIFANINEEELSILVNNVCENMEEMDSVEINEYEMPRRCRRFAKGNIFSDINRDDIRKISPAHETSSNVSQEHETECHPDYRRFALGNIFNDVREDDLLRLMSLCEMKSEDEGDDKGMHTDGRTCANTRRGALAHIFKDVNEEELTKTLSDISYS